MKTEIIEADIVKWLTGNQWLFDNGYLPKYHAVFCDPPYFLGSIVKRFGAKNAAPAKFGKDGAFKRASRGFMGKTWDGFDSLEHYQEWVTEWATLLLSAVYPGALGLFFGGTRTYHRLAAGLEDGGWEIVDSIAYMYGSGFPKSHEVLEGYGTALKPAYEPCIIARAPRGKSTFNNLMKDFGTGAFNIDGGRIAYEGKVDPRTFGGTWKTDKAANNVYEGGYVGEDQTVSPLGRWPANLLLSHCEECTDTICTKDCPVRNLGEQSGEKKAGGSLSGNEPSHAGGKNAFGRWEREPWQSYDDEGTAARFFYTAKTSTWEREAGLDGFELKDGSVGDRRPSDSMSQRIHKDTGRPDTIRCNTHPTLKPISITEYLSKLLLPPLLDQPRRILVPFSGSGSEMIGAALAGWDEITGIEREHEYTTIASARLKWWSQFKTYEAARKTKEVKEPEPIIHKGMVIKQMEMFV